MKKYLPYAPLAILMIGMISLQIGNTHQTGLLSNTLSTVSGEAGIEICSKPGDFIRENETACCNIGDATGIEKNILPGIGHVLSGKKSRNAISQKTSLIRHVVGFYLQNSIQLSGLYIILASIIWGIELTILMSIVILPHCHFIEERNTTIVLA